MLCFAWKTVILNQTTSKRLLDLSSKCKPFGNVPKRPKHRANCSCAKSLILHYNIERERIIYKDIQTRNAVSAIRVKT